MPFIDPDSVALRCNKICSQSWGVKERESAGKISCNFILIYSQSQVERYDWLIWNEIKLEYFTPVTW